MSGARVRLGELLDDRYRLEAIAGRGGIGVVHRAADTRTGDAVQVTVLYARIRAVFQADAAPRMLHAVAGLPDDLLAVPLAVGADPVPALVTAPVEGRSLAAVVAEQPLGEAVVAALGARLAEALGLLHGRGLVHGLLRPTAVALRREDGRPLLLDVGVTALLTPQHFTAFERLIGTAAYVSPEQVWNDPAGPAADVYALGLLLIEALTGTPAFPGTSASDAVGRTLTAPAVPDGIDPGLAALLARMTAFRPEDRPSAVDAADDLGRLAAPAAAATPPEPETLPVAVAPPPTIPLEAPLVPAPPPAASVPPHPAPARRPRRRRSGVLVVTALALVACALTAGGSATPAERTALRSPVATAGEGRRISAEHAGAPPTAPMPIATATPTQSPHRSVAPPVSAAAPAPAPVDPAPEATTPSRPRPSASATPSAKPTATAKPSPKPTLTPTATPAPTATAAPTTTPATTTPAPTPQATAG
jgi:hypothetical protein